MEDTPSNYNIANGRLEGKSMGLKAILLYAKNQGINLGGDPKNLPARNAAGINGGPLPQIQEEALGIAGTPNHLSNLNKQSAVQSSGEAHQWKAMQQPITERSSVIHDESLGLQSQQ